MGRLLNWLKSKRLFVQDHLNHKNPVCKPNEDWWIIVYVLQKVMELCNKYMIEILGKQPLIAQQKEVLERLRERLMDLGQVQNSITFFDAVDVAQAGGFLMSNQLAKLFIWNLGDLDIISTFQTLEQQDPDAFGAMNTNITQMFVHLIHGLFILSPKRDSSNNATTQLPS